MKLSEQFTAFKYPVNMLPKVQDVLDASGKEEGECAVTWYSCKTNIFYSDSVPTFAKELGERQRMSSQSLFIPAPIPPRYTLTQAHAFKFKILYEIPGIVSVSMMFIAHAYLTK